MQQINESYYNVGFCSKVGGKERQFFTIVTVAEADNGEKAEAEVKAWLDEYAPNAQFYGFDSRIRMFPYPEEEDDEFLEGKG